MPSERRRHAITVSRHNECACFSANSYRTFCTIGPQLIYSSHFSLRIADSNQGFGRVSLVDSLPLNGANSFGASFIDKATIKNGETLDFDFDISSNEGRCTDNEFRATLVWTDPPGATGCVRCLLNDLDLSVRKFGSSRVYYPNGLGSRDTTNNVERVILGNAVAGDTIRVTIDAANLDRAEQPFALYVSGCTPSLL